MKRLVITAHPDDEIIWFSGLLDQNTHLIWVFMDAPEESVTSTVTYYGAPA